jgi:hypothetical protein
LDGLRTALRTVAKAFFKIGRNWQGGGAATRSRQCANVAFCDTCPTCWPKANANPTLVVASAEYPREARLSTVPTSHRLGIRKHPSCSCSRLKSDFCFIVCSLLLHAGKGAWVSCTLTEL